MHAQVSKVQIEVPVTHQVRIFFVNTLEIRVSGSKIYEND